MEKEKRLAFRLSLHQHAKLLEAANYKKMTRSEFIREILSTQLDGSEPVVKLSDMLSRIGMKLDEIKEKLENEDKNSH